MTAIDKTLIESIKSYYFKPLNFAKNSPNLKISNKKTINRIPH